MKYVEFDNTKPLDFIPIGRIAIDFNPTDMYMPQGLAARWDSSAAFRQISLVILW